MNNFLNAVLDDWHNTNRRRGLLIARGAGGRQSDDEVRELEELQKLADLRTDLDERFPQLTADTRRDTTPAGDRAFIQSYLDKMPACKEFNLTHEDELSDAIRDTLEDILAKTAPAQDGSEDEGRLVWIGGPNASILTDDEVLALVTKWAATKAGETSGHNLVSDLCYAALDAAEVDDMGGCPLCQS